MINFDYKDNYKKLILARLRLGEPVEAIAQEFTDALNEANLEYITMYKQKQDKQLEDLDNVINTMTDYLIKYYPEFAAGMTEDYNKDKGATKELMNDINGMMKLFREGRFPNIHEILDFDDETEDENEEDD